MTHIDFIAETEEKVKIELQSESGDISDIKDSNDLRTDETVDTSTTPVSGGILKRVKRRRTKSEGSLDESFSGNDSSPQKRKKHEVSFNLPEETDKGAGSGKKKSRKRKNRSKTVDVAVVSQDSVKEKDGSVLEKKDTDKTVDNTEGGGKKRKVNKVTDAEKSDVDSGQTFGNDDKNADQNESETKTDSDTLAGKKRKLDSQTKESSKDENIQEKKRKKDSNTDSSVSHSESETETGNEPRGKIGDGAVVTGNEVAAKKRKNRHRRKQHKQKEVPELRVIPK